FTLRLPRSATEVVEALAKRSILAGVPGGRLFPKERDLANLLLVTATEMTTDEDMDRLANGLAEVLK
ncbi:MAG: glycine dehydrogenase subunit 1, partial [Rhodospirillales bacterium]|nr:glycine dehydrogenase subunit 1 [Rhodospirillales bacterium]